MNILIKHNAWAVALLLVSHVSLAHELTIDQAVALALKNSAAVKSSEAELDAQSNKHVASWLDLGPRLSASYDHVFFDKKLFSPMSSDKLLRDDVTRTGALLLTQPLTPLFALVQKGRIENKQKNIKASALTLTKAQVAFKAAELFVRAQQSIEMWKVATASVQSSVAQKKDGEALHRAERIHRGELLKFELALSQASMSEAKERAAKDIALFSLKELTGLHEDFELRAAQLESEDDQIFERLPNTSDALEAALRGRQELKQAALGQQIASTAKSTAWAKFFPVVNLFAKIEHNFGEPAFGQAKNNKMLGFNLNWEFWNNGAHFFEAREASFNAMKSLYQADVIKQNIRLEVMQILSSLKALREGLALAKKAVEQANEAYRIEKLQFVSGKSTATQVVLSESAKTKADGSLITFLSDLKIQKLKLQQALGGSQPELQGGPL